MHAPQLKAVSNTLAEVGSLPMPINLMRSVLIASVKQELAQVTDQHVVADLRAADSRAGHWLDDDPSLSDILGWIQAHS